MEALRTPACIQFLEPRILLDIAAFTEYRGANAQHQFGGTSDDMVSWNVNLVRETVHLFDRAPLGYGSIQEGSSWFHGLQGVVDRNRQNGITTILCPFSWNGSGVLGEVPSQTSYWAQFNTRLYEMAAQFKDQPDVWIEFWNEPYAWDKPTGANQWALDMEVMIASVRSAGNMNKIVVPGGMMGGDETVAISRGEDLLEFDPSHNLVFDIHAYNYWFDQGQASMDARMQNMVNSGLDFIFGEFGTYTPGGIFDITPFLTALQKNRLGGLAWFWGGADSNNFFRSDGTLNSDASNFYWGQKVKDYITASTTVLPTGWANFNIGNPAPVSAATYNSGTFTVKGAGSDIWGTTDQFAFVHRELSGAQVLSAQIATLQNTDFWAKAGLMVRASSAANSPFVAIELTPANGLRLQARAAAGGETVDIASVNMSTGIWVRLVRDGSQVTAYYAKTLGRPAESEWQALGSPQTISFGDSLYLGGLAVTSHKPGSLAAATFTEVTFASRTGLTDGWTATDIGSPQGKGTARYQSGVYTLSGAGTGLAASDQFHFTSTRVEDDLTLAARVASVQSAASAGIMLRESNAADAPYAAVLLTPAGLQLQARRQTGAVSIRAAIANATGAQWIRLRRVGERIDAWYSPVTLPAASDWLLLGSVEGVTFGGYRSRAGLVVASGGATLASAAFSDVSISRSDGLPLGWSNQDIGATGVTGSASHQGSALFTHGGGGDIWNTSDAFNYSYTSVTGDQVLVTRITSQRNTNSWAKAGPMFRTGATAGAAFVALEQTPGNGIHLQVRTANGGSAIDVASVAAATPAWLKLVRSGSTFSAFYANTIWAPAGSEWKLLGSLQNPAFGANAYLGGLANCSHNTATAATATFDNTSLIARPQVSSLMINEGSAQRSMVRELTLSLSDQVSFPNGAVSLLTRNGQSVPFILSDMNGDGRTYRIRFANGASLPDGLYTLSLAAEQIRGREDLALTGNTRFSFHRLFGDSDGDRDVDKVDYSAFRRAMTHPAAQWLPIFDFNDDGAIDQADFARFRNNMLRPILR